MMNILTTMTSLDSNIKSLQEKAQVWDVFQHHIGAWNDHIKSVDQKMELLKKYNDLKFIRNCFHITFVSLGHTKVRHQR